MPKEDWARVGMPDAKPQWEGPRPSFLADQSSGGQLSMEDVVGALVNSLTDPKQYAVLGAEARRGLKDLQDMVLNPFPTGFPVRDEPGAIGSPTQAIVTEEIKGEALYGKNREIDLEP